MKTVIEEPKPAAPDRVNVYTCEKCGGYTVTIDIHEGVTPFMLRCRASGQEGDCDGPAYSRFYPKDRPIPPNIPAPSWEWFKPVGSEYRKLNRAMREHIDKGGLDIRKRATPALDRAIEREKAYMDWISSGMKGPDPIKGKGTT